jgi:hypothetical protein
VNAAIPADYWNATYEWIELPQTRWTCPEDGKYLLVGRFNFGGTGSEIVEAGSFYKNGSLTYNPVQGLRQGIEHGNWCQVYNLVAGNVIGIGISKKLQGPKGTSNTAELVAVKLVGKYPKVLYDATRMPQHFMGPPDTDHADPTNHITTQTGSWTVDKPGYVKCQFEALSYGSSTRRALARNGNIFYRHDLTNSAAATVVVPHIEVVPGDVITFDLTNCTNPACYYVPPLWMLPVFINGADLQSSTDPGKVDIDPDTKTMAVTGVPQADFDHPDPSVAFTGSFVTQKTGFYYININPASGTSTARLTIQGNIVAAAYGNGSWFGVIEAGKTVDRIEAFSPNSNYIFYPIKWVK